MPFLFFAVAALYATVGFGGGSSYIALLVLFDYPFAMLPIIALTCNLVVVSGGAWHFGRQGYISRSLVLPFLVTSVPFAYLGGRVPIGKDLFLILLGISLLFAGIRMIMATPEPQQGYELPSSRTLWFGGGVVGTMLGFLSGLVGIGGGIFLAPVLHLLRWGNPKQIAATAALFILLNSGAGLAGQLVKRGGAPGFGGAELLLLVAVFFGGQIGSTMGSGRLSHAWVRGLTACLVLFVAGRILVRSFLL